MRAKALTFPVFLLLFLGMGLWGCSEANYPIANPHGDNPVAEHPELVFTMGLESCTACHGSDFSGGSSGVNCLICHPDGPLAGFHGPDPLAEHPDLAVSKGIEVCRICHGADYSGGISGVSCLGCHPAGPVLNPHGPDPYAEHPILADTLGIEICKSCHGADYNGGVTGIGCLGCHPNAPPFAFHDDAWTIGHGSFADTSHWSTCAADLCHGADLGGGTAPGVATGPSCFAALCHQSAPPAPHAVPFDAPEAHGQIARDRQAYCLNCHGTPPNFFDGGFVADPAIMDIADGDCTSCHPDAFAHPTNWSGSNDATPGYLSSHRGVAAAAIDVSCALCHAVDGPGTGPLVGAPSCFSASFTNADDSLSVCHEGGPGVAHPTDISWLDRNAEAFHGTSALDCAACHNLATDCSTCHFGPDGDRSPTSWVHDANARSSHHAGVNESQLPPYQTVCNTCHNIERQLGYAPGSCHNCH